MFCDSLKIPIKKKMVSLFRKTPYLSHFCYTFDLRTGCYIIGYLTLIASIVDISWHITLTAYVSNGFDCDPDVRRIKMFNLPWVSCILLVLNLGTHGFYEYPPEFQASYKTHNTEARSIHCYPGMLHIHLSDILIFAANVLWLEFVICYVIAVHKKNLNPMRFFFNLTLIRLIVQILCFIYKPFFEGMAKLQDGFVLLQVFDMWITVYFMLVVQSYIKRLIAEKTSSTEERPGDNNSDRPPSYAECLIKPSDKEQETESRTD